MISFLEATFNKIPFSKNPQETIWKDYSTIDYYKFTSVFGIVQIRKRTSYPKTFAFTRSGILIIGYGDHLLKTNILKQPLHTINESIFYDKEFLYIEVDARKEKITIQRDALCTLPLFLAEDSKHWIISNNYERMLNLVNRKEITIDRQCVIEAVLGLQTHRRTLIKKMHCIYDRARVIITKRATTLINPPDSSLVVAVKEMKSDPFAFQKRLNNTLESYRQLYVPNKKITCMLSGGCDSTLIAGYYADTGCHVDGITFGFPGEYRKSQLQKLYDISHRFNLRDLVTPLDNDLDFPFSAMIDKKKWHPFYHDQDIYTSPTRRILKYCSKQKITTLFTGLGGDELFEKNNFNRLVTKAADLQLTSHKSLHSYFTPYFLAQYKKIIPLFPFGYEPVTLQSYSMTKNGFYLPPDFFDYNIWPVSPLADPRLYLYCQGLHRHYQKNKNLVRAYMNAYLFPKSVYEPTVNEDFLPFLYSATKKNLLPIAKRLLSNSVLASSGLIDSKKAMEKFSTITNSSANYSLIFDLIHILKVEINLQYLGITKI